MTTTVYQRPSNGPTDRSVEKEDAFLVCKKKEYGWLIIESQYSAGSADRAMLILAEHDMKNRHIKSFSEYRVFHRNEVTIDLLNN